MEDDRSSSPRSTAAIPIVSINYDALMEVLVLLPPKSVIRFQSVCKHLQALIFDEYFKRLHTRSRNLPEPQPSFLLRARTSQFFYFNLTIKKLVPFYFRNLYHVKIMQSCNGLLLLRCRDSDAPRSRREYYVYNPTTKQSRNLLIGNTSSWDRRRVPELCLVFDPSKSEHYKVYYFIPSRSMPDSKYNVAVHNSRTHGWRQWWTLSRTIVPPFTYRRFDYWIRPHGRVFCFDLVRGEYSVCKAPDDVPVLTGRTNVCAFESDGCKYCAILSNLDPDKDNLIIYEKFFANSWSWIDCFQLGRTVQLLAKNNISNIRILGIISIDGSVLDYDSVVLHVPGKIMVHELSLNGASEVLLDLKGEDYYNKGELQFVDQNAHQFIESLAPV